MNELEATILVVFIINCLLNVLVIAYFRTVIREEKELNELFSKEYEYFCEISKYWHQYLRMRGWEEEEKDGVE